MRLIKEEKFTLPYENLKTTNLNVPLKPKSNSSIQPYKKIMYSINHGENKKFL